MYRSIVCKIRVMGQQGVGVISSLLTVSSRSAVAECATGAPQSDVALEALTFDHLALRELPVDETYDKSQRQVRGACFSRVETTQLKNPRTVIYSTDAMELLGLPEDELKRTDFAEFFSGNRLLSGSQPAAHCYCGHQFGYFAGQLGDGAAVYV